jgi:hypothetical protein
MESIDGGEDLCADIAPENRSRQITRYTFLIAATKLEIMFLLVVYSLQQPGIF